jgi:hypothetical protein
MNDWLSATSTFNWFVDPMLDWFKYSYYSNSNKTNKKGSTIVKDYLCQQGNSFEYDVIKLICTKMGKNVVNLNNHGDVSDVKARETLKYMKEGKYVIFSGVLHDVKHKTYGIPDILIRSDVLNKLVVNDVLDIDEETINAPFLGKQKYHYRVIDIKYQTLQLRSDGIHLLNAGHMPSYKAQLLIYNQALGYTQGYEPQQTYILGRRWVSHQCNNVVYNDSCFDKLGVIDYSSYDDKYIKLTKKALQWVRLCKSPAAKKWDVFKYPLKRPELYPNMCNTMDTPYNELKKEIASTNHELTELWQVGKKHRDIALASGINNWKDKKCNALALGIKGKRGNILNDIIYINKDSTKALIHPKVIDNNLYDWKHKDNIEFFVDFEYKNAVFDQMIKLPIADKTILLFTIGVGYMDNNKWVFKHFTVDHLTDQCERSISEDFLHYIHNVSKKYGVENPKAWVFSSAEEQCFNNVMLKHPSIAKMWKKYSVAWSDLLKIFRETPIVIKGCLNFKLKSIAKAMYEHGFISSIWEDSKVADGQSAMIHTIMSDKDAIKKKVKLSTLSDVKVMLHYNEMDVKVLQEILHYLRTYQQPQIRNKRVLDLPSMNTRSHMRNVKRKLC